MPERLEQVRGKGGAKASLLAEERASLLPVPCDIHYTEAGYRLPGQKVAEAIRAV